MEFLGRSPAVHWSPRTGREAANIAEFLENPTLCRPRPEYISGAFAVEDDTVLTHCIKVQNVAAVEVLLKLGADPNQPSRKGVAPISGAAHKGNVAIMRMLIESGAAVNATNSTGSTALIQAAHFGHLEAVQLLLLYNAAADFANQKGTTALMRASQEGHVDITKCLISAHVDVNKKNHEGMNALMLASQRGHANIVFVLVKAGAQMDEQTAQGSTALMLACKRGHEKCAEVLVTMGAEIYMRDRRMRTARDTAQRRNHINMLFWLDTQVQVTKIQQKHHEQRAAYLVQLRRAYLKNGLQLNPSLQSLSALYDAVSRITLRGEADKSTNTISTSGAEIGAEEDESLVVEFTRRAAVGYVAATRSPAETFAQVQVQVSLARPELNMEIASLPVYRSSARLALRHTDYAEWQWPFLLNRCMTLPSGVFELVADYLPLPRIWHWSLIRLRRRCKLAPYQAVQDISIIMDEIMRDAAIFAGRDQSNLLTKLNRSPQVHEFLVEKLGMSEGLVDTLCEFADAQGMLLTTTEGEVAFKPHYARKMLAAAVELYRWHRMRTSALKAMFLQTHQPSTGLDLQMRGGGDASRRDASMCDEEEADGMETTDVAGEEEEGQEDNEDEASDFEAEFVAAEPDSDNEMAVDEEGGAVLGDSDSDNGGGAVGHPLHHLHGH